ncbi:MAG: hypothetical protein IPM24_16365 [Bryobacterales bacterium]|nr:hypothetical protein [Bryobacterales bacterium]
MFFFGPAGAAKTTTITRCGLEPELVAGQVMRDGVVAPTSLANLWYSRGTVFLEAAGSVADDESAWTQLVRKLKPGRLAAALGRGGQAPRLAVVCCDCSLFFQQGAAEAVGSLARSLRQRLGEMAKTLGTQVPVYVLFTKADRIPFFLEYVQTFTNDEATQVFGATLPFDPRRDVGVYAEQESNRLNGVFQELYHSLAEHRLRFLPRENAPDKQPGIYEFPREFRKLRSMVVEFLVEVARPSQLEVSPVLRGFYFTGVRPVIVEDLAPAQPRAQQRQQSEKLSLEATSIFSGPRAQAGFAEPQQAAGPTSRKVPQWMFLTRLFSDVITADKAAFGTSGGGVGVSRLRRMLLAAAAALLVLLSIAFTVSFFGNRTLQANIREAAFNITAPGATTAGQELPSKDALDRLEALRVHLATLVDYERNGVPLRLRWGLYENLYPLARRTYFDAFRRVMFGDAHAALFAGLKGLPQAAGPADDYGAAYNRLRAYLITTAHPEYSTPEFLTPVLMSHWLGSRKLEDERMQLAARQFDFYGSELKAGNPYELPAEAETVARTRRYLNSFGGIERVYQAMLAEAGKENPAVNFNKTFPGSARVVINQTDVPGAFTKGGFAVVQDFLKNSDKYLGGELWVLGEATKAQLDADAIAQLRSRYLKDFIERWRGYLKTGVVVRYGNIKDAAGKLAIHSGNQAPLLAMFSLASQNTAPEVTDDTKEDAAKIAEAFQPVHFVTPPEVTDRFIGPNNQSYVTALVSLQSSIERIPNNYGPGDMNVAQARNDAANAKVTTRQVTQNFRIDREGRIEQVVEKLMMDPITHVEGLLRDIDPASLNGAGKQFCGPYSNLMQKYPFNPNAQAQASLAELNQMFQPGAGLMWQFYDQTLSKVLVEQGNSYTAKPGIDVTLNPQFVAFFNRMVVFSKAVYQDPAGNPRLPYQLKAIASDPVQRITLNIDGVTAQYQGAAGQPAQFVWPGAAVQGARVSGQLGGAELDILNYQGPWAVFRLFHEAEGWRAAGNVYAGEWAPRTSGQPMMSGGKQVKIPFEINLGNAPPVFQKGYFAGLVCVDRIALR